MTTVRKSICETNIGNKNENAQKSIKKIDYSFKILPQSFQN